MCKMLLKNYALRRRESPGYSAPGAASAFSLTKIVGSRTLYSECRRSHHEKVKKIENQDRQCPGTHTIQSTALRSTNSAQKSTTTLLNYSPRSPETEQARGAPSHFSRVGARRGLLNESEPKVSVDTKNRKDNFLTFF